MTFLANSAIDELLGLLAVAAHLRRGLVLRAGQRPRRRGRALGLRVALASVCALNWSWIWPTASLRNVPGPKTTLTGLAARQRAHGPSVPPGGTWPGGRVARDAALEAQHAQEVGGQRRAAVTGSRTST